MGSALHEDGGVSQSGDDAVPAHEVHFVHLCFRHIFRQQSAVMAHLLRRLAMPWRIEGVQSVSQYAHCGEVVGDRLPMSIDVHAVGQSADDNQVLLVAPQSGDETPDEVLSVGCAVTGADDADNVGGIQ